jgi:hypothetical protein
MSNRSERSERPPTAEEIYQTGIAEICERVGVGFSSGTGLVLVMSLKETNGPVFDRTPQIFIFKNDTGYFGVFSKEKGLDLKMADIEVVDRTPINSPISSGPGSRRRWVFGRFLTVDPVDQFGYTDERAESTAFLSDQSLRMIRKLNGGQKELGFNVDLMFLNAPTGRFFDLEDAGSGFFERWWIWSTKDNHIYSKANMIKAILAGDEVNGPVPVSELKPII